MTLNPRGAASPMAAAAPQRLETKPTLILSTSNDGITSYIEVREPKPSRNTVATATVLHYSSRLPTVAHWPMAPM
jgi:hypothetical protein